MSPPSQSSVNLAWHVVQAAEQRKAGPLTLRASMKRSSLRDRSPQRRFSQLPDRADTGESNPPRRNLLGGPPTSCLQANADPLTVALVGNTLLTGPASVNLACTCVPQVTDAFASADIGQESGGGGSSSPSQSGMGATSPASLRSRTMPLWHAPSNNQEVNGDICIAGVRLDAPVRHRLNSTAVSTSASTYREANFSSSAIGPPPSTTMAPSIQRPPSAAALLAMAAAAASAAVASMRGLGSETAILPTSPMPAARPPLDTPPQLALPPRPAVAAGGPRPIPLNALATVAVSSMANHCPNPVENNADSWSLLSPSAPPSVADDDSVIPPLPRAPGSVRATASGGGGSAGASIHRPSVRWREAPTPSTLPPSRPGQSTSSSSTVQAGSSGFQMDVEATLPSRSEICSPPTRRSALSGGTADVHGRRNSHRPSVNTAGPPGSSSHGSGHRERGIASSGSSAVLRAKSMPAPAEKLRREHGDKGYAATPTLRKGRGNPGSSSLPRATAAAAAGAGCVAAKVRKKGGLPRKMVLPFSYAVDDPRHYHVESTEGRACPEFLPH